jgi:hypothetical protein
MLLEINAKLKLKFTPIEDATLGFWLMSMDLRHDDHPKSAARAPPVRCWALLCAVWHSCALLWGPLLCAAGALVCTASMP